MAGRNRPLATAKLIVTARLFVTAALIVIVAGACGSGAGDDVQPTEIEFELLNGSVTTVDYFLDRPVVLNFFASWCTPCLAEMPALQSVHRDRPDIAIIGLAINDTRTRALEIVQETRAGYIIGLDLDATIGNAFGIVGMPTTLFIPPDGEVAYRHTGGLTANQITEHINTHLTP